MLNLRFERSREAIEQRTKFLKSRNIGICDIVASAERTKVDASDLGMQNVKLRNLLDYVIKYPNVNTLLFTGGNSKNGPEYFFRKLLKEHGLKLEVVSGNIPRIHQFVLKVGDREEGSSRNSHSRRKEERGKRVIKTVSLTAPSGAANRAVGSLQAYKDMKNQNPAFTTIDFRALQYAAHF